MPLDLPLHSVYANIQALKYHDRQSNKAKSGNQKPSGKQTPRGNRRNRRGGGQWRGHGKKTIDSAAAKAGVKSVDGDGQVEGNSDDEDQPAEGAVAATKMGANSCEGPQLLVKPQPQPSTVKHQQPSEGGVASLPVGDNHQQLPQTKPADSGGARQQLQCAGGVTNSPFTPTSPLIQGTSTTGVVSAATGAGPQLIHPQKTSAATSTHQLLQGASGDITAADKNNTTNSLETQQLPIGKLIHIHLCRHISII